MTGRAQHFPALLAVLCCAACTPGGEARDGGEGVKLGEERAIADAREMLEARAPAAATPSGLAAAPPAEPR